jgi:ATP-binding cassette subfamily B protein
MMDRVNSAAQKARADTVIAQLPLGYDQMLGRRFDGGVDLSAGQWQKIALARAYMRDAQVLVLDEPTASLDARAEYEVFQQFTRLTRGRMAVLISHRFSTVRMADRILVLEDGRILEQGSHHDLVAIALEGDRSWIANWRYPAADRVYGSQRLPCAGAAADANGR